MEQKQNLHQQQTDDLTPWKQALTEFRENCRAGPLSSPGAIRECLVRLPCDYRSDALVDLVCTHLKESWRRGVSASLDAYVDEFARDSPEFTSQERLPLEIIECEFLARHTWPDTADHPTVGDYERCFPERPEVVDRLRLHCLDGGRYVLIRQQWQGGLGKVWVGYDTHLQRYVAIKEPNPDVAGDARIGARLAEEARLTAGLDHPGIIAVHELLDVDGRGPCYVMRLVEGRTLRERIRDHFQCDGAEKAAERRLRLTRLLQACIDVCEAIAFAHQRQVLHRDLKSANVVLGKFGETVLLDWGLAARLDSVNKMASPDAVVLNKVLDVGTSSEATVGSNECDLANGSGSLTKPPDTMAVGTILSEDSTSRAFAVEDPSATLTRTGLAPSIVGTIPYMSPEQAAGSAEKRSDVFGLGAILYEILTGHPPYEPRPGEMVDDVLCRVRAGDYRSPRQVRKAVPRPLEAVCLKALSWRVEDRYPGALSLADDLRRWLADEPVSVYPNGIHHRLGRQFRRHTGAVIATAALVILLLLAASLAGYNAVRNERREVALQELHRIRASQRREGWSVRSWELVEQAAQVRVGSDLRDAAVAALSGLDVRRVKSFDFETYSVAFSPDGERLLIGGYGEDGTRWWDRRQDELSPPLPLGPGRVGFAADGSPWQVVSRSSLRYEIWNVEDRAVVCELEIPFDQADLPERLQTLPVMELSADGTMLAASPVLPDGSPTIALWNVSQRRLIRQWPMKARSIAFSPDDELMAVGDAEGRIHLWSVSTGEVIAELASDSVSITALGFGRDVFQATGPDSIPWLLATGDAGGTVTVWDLNRRIPRSYSRGSQHHIYRVAFSPDGVKLASCGRYLVRLWDVASGRLLLDIGAGNTIYGLAFSPDGRSLAFGCIEAFTSPGRVEVLELEDGRGIRTLQGLPTSVIKVCFSSDGRLLAGLSHDWKVGIWELASGRLMSVLRVPEGYFTDNTDLFFDPEGQQLAFASGTRATLWDVQSGVLKGEWELPPGLNDLVRFHPEGRVLLFRTETQDMQEGPFTHVRPDQHPRVCRVRDLLSPNPEKPLAEITHFDWYVFGVYASSDGKQTFIEGLHRTPEGTLRSVRAYDSLDGRELWALDNPTDDTACMLFIDPTDRFVQVGRRDGTARRTHPLTGEFLGEMREYRALSSGGVLGAKPQRGGFSIYRLGQDSDVALLDLAGTGATSCLQPEFSPDGRYFAWGNETGTVFVCDIQRTIDRLAEFDLGP